MTTGNELAGRARLLDTAIVVVIGGMVEWVAWNRGWVGDHMHGPRWLTSSLPLLYAAPLIWRRSQALMAAVLVNAGIATQALVSQHSAEGLGTLFAFGVASYSVAAYSARRHALMGLLVVIAGYGVFAGMDANLRTGRASEVWAAAFFGALDLAMWLIGSWVHSRREAEVNAIRAAALEREAEIAVTVERSRVARELHDIVSHNLSVVVLQAAGARTKADDGQVSSTLEKIEESGREALVEMRRMLDVLRADDDAAELSPAPGLNRLEELCDGVRQAGVPVDLHLDECGDVPPAVALSAYRIVQEALTNTLKHAGTAQASVSVRRTGGAITIEVRDNGRGSRAPVVASGGHGLIGMRERALLLGGELHAGCNGDGGFVVRARLPLDEHTT